MRQLGHDSEFKKLFQNLCIDNQSWKVFSDFCEMSAISLANSVTIKNGLYDERENRYLEISKQYSEEDLRSFSKLLLITIAALDVERDFLGDIFMSLELSNHWKGQLFTPDSICQSMAQMIFNESMAKMIKEKGFVTVSDPACGAGATLIALMKVIREGGINYQQTVHATAIDIDPTAAHMCFIQLSLLNVPAIVYIGNTISMQIRSALRTPAHEIGCWDYKLKKYRNIDVKDLPFIFVQEQNEKQLVQGVLF